MVSYTKSFRIKYPEPNYAFLDKELVPYIERHPDDKEAGILEALIISEYTPARPIKKMFYWRVRKRVAEWRDRCWLEWSCNPETETYKCM